MLKNIWRAQWIIVLLFLVFLPAQPSEARLRGVHAAAACGDCHADGFAVGLFSQAPRCFLCHDSLPNPTKKLAEADASQLFNYTGSVTLGTSHAWGVTYNEPGAGASSPRWIGQTQYGPGKLGCSSCHYPHYYLNNLTSQPLLKTDNSEDALCLDCHRDRNVDSASTPQPGKQRSHPVGVPVPATTAFNDPSINIYGVAGSDLRLLGAGNNVSCSTCHGVHFADSNPWTDATSANLSSVPNGKGVLLRRYNDSQLCKDCHNFQGHSVTGQMTCRNCHDPHLGTGTNLRLINPLINTPRYGNRTTVFDNLSVGFAWRSDGKIGVCEACHTINPALQPYSSPFPNWSSIHANVSINKSEGGTTDCLFCHNHAEGAGFDSFLPTGAAACSGCHGFPPSVNVFSGPSGFAEYSTEALGNYDYFDGVNGPASPKDESQTPHKRHATDYPFAQGGGEPGPTGSCYACHATANHQNGEFQNVVFGLYSKSAGVWGAFDNESSGGNTRTCTDVYCHSDFGANDFIGNPQTTADWDITPGTFGCNDCHLNPPITNRHTPHAEGNYNYGCINCHTNTVSDNTTIANELAGVHVNGIKNVDFGSVAATSGLQSYSTSSNTCQDVWCHGEFSNGNKTNDPDWDLAGTQPCGTCHALPPIAEVATHTRHVTDYGFDCAHCHGEASEMVFGVVSAINNYSSHVNGVKDVKFQNDGVRDIASGTFNSGSKKCANIYCHSNGTVTAQPFFVNATAMWTDSMTCKSCHGNDLNDGDYKRATPLYPNTSPKENSHETHVIDNGLQCQDCHNETVNADNVSIKNYTAHVNGNYNIDIASAYDSNGAGTSNYNLGSKQCSGIKCHGSGTPEWGTDNGLITCESCHGSGADLDDFVFQSFSGTAALIDSVDFANTGHGKATGNYPETGLPAANRACLHCHDENIAHGDGTNPFRLMTSDPNQFCLGCHGDAGDRAASWNFAGMSSIDMQSHTHSNISSNGYVAPDLSDNWRITPKCVDCHDPHGDSNLAMIHDKVATKGSNAFGIPSSTYFNASTVVFTGFTEDVAGTFSYNALDLTSVCRACHSATIFHNQTGGAAHNYDLDCTSCHKHETGFTPAGCNGGCHGYPPADTTMLVYSSGTDTPGPAGTGSTTVGAHEEHVTNQAIGCASCHAGGMAAGISENGNITLGFEAYGSYTTGEYRGQTVVRDGFYGYSGTGVLGNADNSLTCNGVKCHGSALPNGNGADITPVWNDPATAECGDCHAVKKNPGDPTYPTSNAHETHLNNTTYDFMCKTCHSATVLGTSTTLSVPDHVNGLATIELYTSDNRISTTATYNGDDTIGSGYGDCTNTYCHSDGTAIIAPFAAPFKNISWASNRQCNTCHGNGLSGYTSAMPNYGDGTPKPNKHDTHVRGNGIECRVCHYATTEDNATIADTSVHVNQLYNLSTAPGYDNDGAAAGNFSYNDGTKTCSNIDCHGENDVAWDKLAATIVCQDCHLDSAQDKDDWTFSNFSGAVAKIYSTDWAAEGHGKPGISKACTACHDTSVAHNNGTDYFRLYTSNPDLLCLGCHGSAGEILASDGWNDGGASIIGYQTHSWENISTAGYGRDPLVNISGAANNGVWSFTPKCVDCHDPHGDTNIKMIQSDLNILGSDSRGIPLGNTSTVDFTGVVDWNTFVKADMSGICQRCHDSAVANFDKNSFSNHNAGSKCTGCHKHSEGFKPSACDGCHGTPPVDPGTLINDGGKTTGSTTAGMHATHVGVYTGSDNCNYCHQDGMNVPPNNFNNVIDLKFDAFGNYTTGTYKGQVNVTSISGDYNYGGPAAGTADGTLECSSVKCHGAGLPPGGNGLDTTPFWNVSSTGDCGNCHGVKKVAGTGVGLDGHGYPDTGAHAVHAGYSSSQGQYDFMCKTCHDATVLGTSTTLESTTHVDGRATIVLDADMDRIDVGATYRGDDTIGSGYGDCTNTYCHSMGNTTTLPFATPFDNISWMETRQCNTCHGNGLYSGYTSAMPDYVDGTPKANKHDTHVRSNGIECKVCHYATTEDNTSIADTSVHVNRLYNLSTAPGYDNDGAAAGNFSYDGGTKTCSNIDCHGENDVAWDKTAATIVCQDCHLASAGVEDSWTFGNFSGAIAKIYTSEWASRGHGLNAGAKFAVSSSVGPGLGCTVCHDGDAIAHGTSGDFFRLYTSNPDTLCLGCHGTGGELGKSWTGSGSTLEGIQTHSLQNMSTAGYVPLDNMSGVADWNFTPKCVDCHDPHGDGNNYMIHNLTNYSGSDPQGRPTNGASKSVSFTGQLNWSSYVNAGFTGLCQGCHDSKVANFNKGSFNNEHNPGQRCTDCHKHGEGFKPSGCNICHGNGGDPSGAPPEAPILKGWSSDPTGGAHTAHVTGESLLCSECHADGNGQSTTHGDPAPGKPNASLDNLTALHGDWDGGAKDGYQTGGTIDDTCSNIDCHGGRAYTRTWVKPVDCDDCHGYRASAGAFNNISTGSHYKHTKNGAGYYDFNCTQCHVENFPNYSTHYNSLVNLNFDEGVGDEYSPLTNYSSRGGSVTAFEPFTTSAGDEWGKCASAYCHGATLPSSGGNSKPTWGDTGYTGCENCHYATGNRTLMGAPHPTHLDSATYNFDCFNCHVETTTDNTTINNYTAHVNTNRNVDFDSYLGNYTGSFSGTGTKQCLNIYCHSNGTDNDGTGPFPMGNFTADWDDGIGSGCNYCHGSSAYSGYTNNMPNYTNLAPKENSHDKHVRANQIQCVDCHGVTLSSNTTIGNYTSHVNGNYNIDIDPAYDAGPAASYALGSKECSNVNCHGGNTIAWGTEGLTCFDCHDGTDDDAAGAYKPFSTTGNGANKMSYAQYTSTGHGRSTGTQYPFSTNDGAGKWNAGTGEGCYQSEGGCHDSAAGHVNKDASNPFRLYTALEQLCPSCHNTSAILGHHSTATGNSKNRTWPFNPKCVDCHDPHGDGNIRMIRSYINTPSPSSDWVTGGGSNEWGVPTLDGYTAKITFLNNSGFGTMDDGFVNTGTPGTGLCEVCHSNNVAIGADTIDWYNAQGDGNNTDHQSNQGKKCVTCHYHKEGFAPAGSCDGCHGYPPMVGDGKLYKDEPVNEGKGQHESHFQHLSSLLSANGTLSFINVSTATADDFGNGQNAAICGVCHTNTPGEHKNASRNINYGDGSLEYSFDGGVPFYNGSSFISSTSIGGAFPKTCSNIRCHFQDSAIWQDPAVE